MPAFLIAWVLGLSLVSPAEMPAPPTCARGGGSPDRMSAGCHVEAKSHGASDTQPGNDHSEDDHDLTDAFGTGIPSDCDLEYGFTSDPAAPDFDPTANSSGRRQDYYDVWCNGVYSGYAWFDSSVGGAPAITAADMVPGIWVSVQRQLPKPVPRIAPADFNPDGFTFVQNHTFFWVDQQQGQWAPVTGSASAGGITVSVQATPQRLIIDTGDGQTLTCAGAPPAFVKGMDPTTFQGCAHIYRDSSAMAPNGATFPVTVTIEWSASWSASTGEGGDLGVRRTTSAVRQLAVAESQAVIVHVGD